jgi:hypothetical protein
MLTADKITKVAKTTEPIPLRPPLARASARPDARLSAKSLVALVFPRIRRW